MLKYSGKRFPKSLLWITNTAGLTNGFLTAGSNCMPLLSPYVVPLPMSDESAVDPEEAFIASISSCHMLWFLSLAANKKYTIESYEDNAEGILSKNEKGKLAMTEVNLKPKINFSGQNIPSETQLNEIHHKAHEKCFIAASVKTKINIVK